MYPTDEVDLDGLVRHAGLAMYRSKSLGRGTYSFFSDDLNAAVSARLRLEGGLRHAIELNEFQLYFQPKANLCTGEVTGVEALLRWDCPGEGVVPPDRFIGVLEDTGMILPVGAWVIRTACAQLASGDRQGLPPLRMAVNLSARQFHHLHLASMIEDSLREHAIDAQRLEIELTESLLMEDNEATRNMLESFARMGLKVAIDDFGTGHSSLTYLKRFPIDTLKIDRLPASSLPSDSEDVAITTAVIALGRSMQMKVVAEGAKPRPRPTCCASWAATRCRATCWPARCRRPTWRMAGATPAHASQPQAQLWPCGHRAPDVAGEAAKLKRPAGRVGPRS
jgi:EAL domain-containing protein (putative c-di-GMP-specific phosphodiesterase class I)